MKYTVLCITALLAIGLGGCDMEEEEVPQMDMDNHQMSEPDVNDGPTIDDGAQ